ATGTQASGSASRRGLFYAIGFIGLAIALASIADMFLARPYDGIVPSPYSRTGIEVRATVPGGPAERAGIPAAECLVGIGEHLVNSISDASTELRRHAIGEKVPYLVRRGPCPAAPDAGAAAEQRQALVTLSSERLGGTTYLYFAVLGFLFFFIGLFVFHSRP